MKKARPKNNIFCTIQFIWKLALYRKYSESWHKVKLIHSHRSQNNKRVLSGRLRGGGWEEDVSRERRMEGPRKFPGHAMGGSRANSHVVVASCYGSHRTPTWEETEATPKHLAILPGVQADWAHGCRSAVGLLLWRWQFSEEPLFWEGIRGHTQLTFQALASIPEQWHQLSFLLLTDHQA